MRPMNANTGNNLNEIKISKKRTIPSKNHPDMCRDRNARKTVNE